jgi:hypothetical protein
MSNQSYRQIFNAIVKEEGIISLWRSYPLSYVRRLLFVP